MLLAGCWNLIDRSAQDHCGGKNEPVNCGEDVCESGEDLVQSASSSLLKSGSGRATLLSPTSRLYNAGIFASGLLWGGSTFRYFPASTDILSRRDAYNAIAKNSFVPCRSENKLQPLTSPGSTNMRLSELVSVLSQVLTQTPYLPLAALACAFAREVSVPGGDVPAIVVGCATVDELQGDPSMGLNGLTKLP